MGSLNRVELIGNIGREPEFKDMDDGSKSAKFSLATTEPAYTLAMVNRYQRKQNGITL